MKKINWKNFLLVCALIAGVILPTGNLIHAAEKKMDIISVKKVWNGKAQDKAYFMIEKEVAGKAGEPKFQRIQEQPFEITKNGGKGEYTKEVTVEVEGETRYIVYETDAAGKEVIPFNSFELGGISYHGEVDFVGQNLLSNNQTTYNFTITNSELDKFTVSKQWVGEAKSEAYFKVKYSKPNLGYWIDLNRDNKVYTISNANKVTVIGFEKSQNASYKIVETDKDGKEFSDEITIDGTKYKIQVSGDKASGFVIKNEVLKVTTTSQSTTQTSTTITKPTTKPSTVTKAPTTTKSTTTSKPTTKSSTKVTVTTKSTTKTTTKRTTKPSTKTTMKRTTKVTTKSSTKPSTKPTTKVSTKPSTKATTKRTTKVATKPSTKTTTKRTTKITTKATTKRTTKSTTKPSVKTEPVYRLYHAGIKRHLYTKSLHEVKVLSGRGWTFESEKFRTVPQGTTPVYRLYHGGTREHLYTTGAHERDILKTRGWRYEGVAWYSTGEKPIYRLYHAGLKVHLYTADTNEKNVLSTRGWKYEGVSFYVK